MAFRELVRRRTVRDTCQSRFVDEKDPTMQNENDSLAIRKSFGSGPTKWSKTRRDESVSLQEQLPRTVTHPPCPARPTIRTFVLRQHRFDNTSYWGCGGERARRDLDSLLGPVAGGLCSSAPAFSPGGRANSGCNIRFAEIFSCAETETLDWSTIIVLVRL